MENNIDFFLWVFWAVGWISVAITFVPTKTKSRTIGFIVSMWLYGVLMIIYVVKIIPK